MGVISKGVNTPATPLWRSRFYCAPDAASHNPRQRDRLINPQAALLRRRTACFPRRIVAICIED